MKLKIFSLGIIKEYTPLAGGVMNWVADDTLDSATFRIVSDTSTPFENTAVATIVFEKGDGTEIESIKMLVGADNVEPFAKGAGKYVHNLMLVELTKILEKFTNLHYISTMDTQLSTQIDTAFENLNTLIYGKYIDFLVSPTTFPYMLQQDDLLKSENSPFYGLPAEDYINENATAREILDGLFSTVNARAVVTDITNNYIIKVGVMDMNKTTDKTEVANRLGTFWQNNIDNFCGKVVSKVSNATPQSYVFVIDSFKSLLNTATTNNKVVATAFNVEYFADFSLLPNEDRQINVKYTKGDVSYNKYVTIPYPTPLPLIGSKDFSGASQDLLVDKEFWDALDSDAASYTNYVKDNTLYYERGAASVDVSRTYKDLFFTQSVFEMTAKKAMFRYIDLNRVALLGDADCQITGMETSENFWGIGDFIYTAKYAPLVDDVIIEANKTKKQNDRNAVFSITDGQSDNIIDLSRYGRNLVGKAQRIGNDELSIDTNVYGREDVLEPLDKVGDYIVYKTEMQIMSKAHYSDTEDKNWYKVRYSMTKGFNNLAEKIGLAREKRIYQIPLTGYRSTLPIRSSIAYGLQGNFTLLQDGENNEQKKTLSAFLLQRLVNTFPSDMYNAILMNVVVMNYHYVLPVVGFGAGNTMNFIGRFYDNYSAGLSFVAQRNIFKWIGGNKACQNPYVNNAGVAFGFFDISIGNIPALDSDNIKKRPAVGANETFWGFGKSDISYTKDRAESITLQKIYSLVEDNKFTGYKKMRIGEALIRDNYAFEVENRPKLKLYKDCPAKYLDGNAQTFKTSEGTLVGETQDYLEVKYWSYQDINGGYLVVKNDNTEYNNCIIADDNGNIYLVAEKLSKKDGEIVPTTKHYACVALYDEQ
jgi:hypothetical protein|nr:MAG TPA: hypothetical protein [Caudoviricetes sp.]